jgi:O-antigen ligase
MQTQKRDQPGLAASFFSIPNLACLFTVVVAPLLLFMSDTGSSAPGAMDSRYENKIFWPLLALATAIFAARHVPPRGRFVWPPHVKFLLAYLAFAGLSVAWAFAPPISFIRYVQQVMIVACIVLPAMLAPRNMDLLRGMYLCFAIAMVLNIFFVIGGYQTFADRIAIGYSGYFTSKNYLGECAAIALVASLYELFTSGTRRIFGIIVIIISVVLIMYANSKTALGLALLAPVLAAIVLAVRRATGLSPAAFVWLVIIGYLLFATVVGFTMGRLSYALYGDSSFTGRQIIWDFAKHEIEQRPLTGWGYQSFWLVGPDGPSVRDAPGWVKTMPNAHNGYYDTILETGYIGFAILLAFLTATLHGLGRILDRNPARGWTMLSLAFYVIIHNGLESAWVRGFEFMWVAFLILVAEIARYYQIWHQARQLSRNLLHKTGMAAHDRGRLMPH